MSDGRDAEPYRAVHAALEAAARRHGFEDQADRLRQRAFDAAEPPIVMVVGEGNFGKSTLINSLLGASVAPVSVLPLTWKVDLYQPGTEGDQAQIYWRTRPDRPDTTTRDEALACCAKEEQKALAQPADTTWQSDLYQARWYVRSSWPNRPVVLVDTPGFAQLRAGTAITPVKLYGSEAIELAASRPFDYYFYRADLVVWCLRADKLHSEESLSVLRSVSPQEKRTIGVITHMDGVPDDRWDDVIAEAKYTFGFGMEELLPVAGGQAASQAADQTINAVRTALDDALADASTLKGATTRQFLVSELTTFQGSVVPLRDAYREGLETRDVVLEHAEALLDRTFNDAARDLESAWQSLARGALGEVSRIWKRIETSSDRGNAFAAEFNEKILTAAHVDAGLRDARQRLDDRIEAETRVVGGELRWPAVTIGASGQPAVTEWRRQTLRPARRSSAGLEFGTGSSFLANLPSWEILKLLQQKSFEADARRAIEETRRQNVAVGLAELERSKDEIRTAMVDAVDRSFTQHFGEDVGGVFAHLDAIAASCAQVSGCIDELPAAFTGAGDAMFAAAGNELRALAASIDCLILEVARRPGATMPIRSLSAGGVERSIRAAKRGCAQAIELIAELLNEPLLADLVAPTTLLLAIDDPVRQCEAYARVRESLTVELRTALLDSEISDELRALVEEELLREPYDEQLDVRLQRSPNEATRTRARQRAAHEWRALLLAGSRRVAGVGVPMYVTDLTGWYAERDRAITAARAAFRPLGELQPSDVEPEYATLHDAIQGLEGPRTAEASARYREYLAAVASLNRAREQWRNTRIGSFALWGVAVLLLAAGPGLAFAVWLGSFVLFLVAHDKLKNLKSDGAWKRFVPYQSPHARGLPVAGWYPDPYRVSVLRYWDGSRWTQHVADHGEGGTYQVVS